jgi:hypothetical protein
MSQNQPDKGRGLIELIGHALIDPEFRKRVKEEPDKLAEEYGLQGKDAEALRNFDTKKLDEASNELAGRAEWTIAVGIRGHFDAK